MNGAVFTPSFYGFCTWLVVYLFYVSDLLPWDPVAIEVHFILIIQITLFLAATIIFSRFFAVAKQNDRLLQSIRIPSVWWVVCLHIIGFAGIAKFALDFSPNLPDGFVGSLLRDSSQIRALGAEMTSVGTQLSYFGWLAIGISVCFKKINWWLISISLLQILSNFIFIDRTRPVWILFTLFLCLVWTRKDLYGWRVFRYLALLGGFFILLFVAVALWSGKTGDGIFDNNINPLMGSLYLYLTAGFSYFGHMLQVELPPDYFVPERIFAPVLTILSAFGLSSPPPNQILDFYEMPYPSNVGTALEPFYRDGGFVFLTVGMLIYSFGFNIFGLWLLKSRNAVAVYAWATLCFCNFIGFFTPKIGNFPVWFFVIVGVVAALSFSGRLRSGVVK
jgi:oligosaccharide repeat unit polymerase